MMKRIFHIVCLALAALCVSSCGIYSFSGTSIKPDVKSITIDLFEYKKNARAMADEIHNEGGCERAPQAVIDYMNTLS